MKAHKKWILASVFLMALTFSVTNAQGLFQWQTVLDKTALFTSDSLNHSSVRNLYPFVNRYATLPVPFQPFGTDSSPKWPNLLYNKLFHEHLVQINQPEVNLYADPLFDASVGRETSFGTATWTNVRGVQAFGRINLTKKVEGVENVEFYTSYYESQSRIPRYLDSLATLSGGMPGQGDQSYMDGIMDHSYATAWVRYNPNRVFTFEAGHGKNFLGNGYRSVLLSDNARNYPYFRIDTRFWRIRYVNLWAEFQDKDYHDGELGAYQKKYGAFHYFSYSITPKLELSLFEAVIWQGRDSLHTRGFDVTYLNPILFLRAAEWTLGSPDNALLGADLNYRFTRDIQVYGQVLIDEFAISHMLARDGYWANKFAGQVGFKSWIPIELPVGRSRQTSISGVFLQTEANFARPFTYSHWTSKQNYGHLKQPLAHPLGANYFEWITFGRLHVNRLMAETRFSWARYGANYANLNYGQNIFLDYRTHVSELDNYIGQGLKTNLTYASATVSWILNPATLLNVFCTVTDRRQVDAQKDLHSFWITFGVRNSIRNFYYDY